MKTETTPLEQAINQISFDTKLGRQVLQEDQLDDYPAAVALVGAEKAVAALRAVVAAMADLEPGPALVINDALRRGLGVTW